MVCFFITNGEQVYYKENVLSMDVIIVGAFRIRAHLFHGFHSMNSMLVNDLN